MKRQYTKPDELIAVQALPRVADVPPDWKGQLLTKRPCTDGAMKQVVITGEAGDELTEQITYVAAGTKVFRTADMAASAFDRIAREKVVRCLANEFRPHLGDPATVKGVSLARVRAPVPGAHTVAWAIVIHFTHGSFTPDGHVGVVLLERGRTLAVLRFGDVANPFDPTVEARLARTVARRMSGSG